MSKMSWFYTSQRDLWYCALERASIDIRDHLTSHPRIAVHDTTISNRYTPEHYHALRHLQSWDESNFRSQTDRLLQEIPLNKEESREMELIRKIDRILKELREEHT
jgi:hypothetical protein